MLDRNYDHCCAWSQNGCFGVETILRPNGDQPIFDRENLGKNMTVALEAMVMFIKLFLTSEAVIWPKLQIELPLSAF